MSSTIYRGQVLTKDDLNIFVKNENGVFFNPFSIEYTIYRVVSSCFQSCNEEPLLESVNTTPIIFGIGKFFAAWSQAKDLSVGKYKIKWNVRKYSDSPAVEEVEEFDIINRIDGMNYSTLNGGTNLLPHQIYGNSSKCAG
ncbi:MAG: hypothetical protein PHF86_07650 [Candidatus Nanoarchaeia archaeon]|jgi:hypothetical protein|nr:hypothetical protein [Candidatus Nanoarchaeia archaeon]